MIQVTIDLESELIESLFQLGGEKAIEITEALKKNVEESPEGKAFGIDVIDAFIRVKDA